MKKQNKDLTVVGLLRQSYDHFVEENKKLKEENKELKAQIKEFEKERDEVLRECVKLAKLVDKLRDAIEEEEN